MLSTILYLLSTGTTSILFTLLFFTLLYHFVARVWKFIRDRPLDMKGKVVLITGCDSGFGYSAAYELDARGCDVIATCLLQENVQRFIEDENFQGCCLQLDITKTDDIFRVKDTVSEMVKDKGGLWCLLNNAGIGDHMPIDWLSVSDMKRVMDVNLWGTVSLTKALLPLLKVGRGRLVNVSSVMGSVPFAHFVSYCMSKHALEAFSHCLRYEVSPWGVSVHLIASGACPKTKFYDGFQERWPEMWEKQPKDIQEEYGEEFPKKVVQHLQYFMVKVGEKCNPVPVVDAYVHAVTSSAPCRRYLVGIDAWLFSAVNMLPTTLGDVVNWMLHLHKPVMPASCQTVQ